MAKYILKNLAKKTGKDISEIETIWENSKSFVSDIHPLINIKSTDFYSLVLTKVKQQLNLKENFILLDKFKSLLTKNSS